MIILGIKNFSIAFVLSFLCLFEISAQNRRISRQEYIEMYKGLAIKEMERVGIPASIKLAQALLESDNGNSRLARQANNHFGIKCHDWQGRKVYHDDDHRNECFRSYRTVYDSYADHSEFLSGRQRYASLFELRSDDYKRWARGLRRAGYATNPRYADLLIKIIEDNNLHQYDNARVPRRQRRLGDESKSGKISGEVSSEVSDRRVVYQRNRIEFIVVQEGDNLEKITRELNLLPWELARYNDIPEDYSVVPGLELYIQPKRNRAEAGNNYHIVEEGETMHAISQKYGIKLSRLYRRNGMEEGTEPKTGEKLWLRRNRRGEEEVKIENSGGGFQIEIID